MSKAFGFYLIGMLIGCILGLVGLINKNDDMLKQDAITYCRMVHDHRWPDFHHVYRQQCSKDGALNEDWFYGR